MSASSDGIRVLHVVHSGALGGGSRLVEQFATADDGLIHAVATSGDGPLLRRLRSEGVDAFDIRASRKRDLPAAAIRLASVARSWNADVVDCIGQFAGLLAAVDRLVTSVPFLYQAQYPSFYADFDRLRAIRNRLVEGATCRMAGVVLATNDEDMCEFVRRRLAPAWKVHVTVNGVDCDTFRPLPGGAGDVVEIGFVGRLVDWKGVDVLLRALARSPMCAGSPWRLRILGDGVERQALTALAADLGLDERVKFQGGHFADAEWFSSCDIIVVPSLAEPFGIVAAEAMACGRVVIASEVGGLASTVVHGRTGLLVPPGDPVRLSEALDELIADPERRSTMGRAGRSRALSDYSLQQVVEQHRRVLLSIAQGRL